MYNYNKKKAMSNPVHVIIFSFLSIILIGTFALMLPVANSYGKSTSFIDALFTASSAVCVTGLSVVNTLEHWTLFGKVVILILIQIGAIGFMSLFILVLVFLGRKITLKERILIQESFNLTSFKGTVNFLKKIITSIFIVEGIGALILTLFFLKDHSFFESVFYGVFHSISSFCNAGFDLIGQDSLMPYKTNYLFNIVVLVLIVLGGLGFAVWMDCARYIKHLYLRLKKKTKSRISMSLHSKISLTATIFLIILGFFVTLILEFNNTKTLAGLSFTQKLIASLFQSISVRTAGFFTINQADLYNETKFFSVILMAIGGSPGGVAGGIKTVTISVLIFTIISVIKGQNYVVAFKKSISFDTIQKALTVFIMMLSFIFISTILLAIIEKDNSYQYNFIDLLYEATSALGTVGSTTGITPHLSLYGKILIIICMFIGRIGPVSIVIALSFRNNNKSGIRYPEEKIIVG